MTINVKNFLKDKPKLSKMGEFQELQPIEGMEISAISADLYGTGRDDLCLFYFKDGANYGAVYTNNTICSESITWNRQIRKKNIKAIMINTKNANTFTGTQGAEALESLSKNLAKNLTLREAQKKGGTSQVIKPNEILFASTGVIGEKFPIQKIKNSTSQLVEKLREKQNKFVWFKAASSIMTTDTRPKLAYEECRIWNKDIRLSAIAKGSGMISPNMATMLAFVFTDAEIPSVFLKSLLKRAMTNTFNAITVDSDTSTNDMVAIFSSNKVKTGKFYNVLDPKLKDFVESDEEVLRIKTASEDAALLEAMGAVTEEEDNVESLSDLNLDEDNIAKLSNKGIKNKDDLAELSIDELQEIIEISSDDASKMIMKAREHWFN